MRVRVSHPALVPDLVEFLGRASCTTGAVNGSVVDVVPPGEGTRARRELDLFLAAWRGLHPPVETTVLDSEPGLQR